MWFRIKIDFFILIGLLFIIVNKILFVFVVFSMLKFMKRFFILGGNIKYWKDIKERD